MANFYLKYRDTRPALVATLLDSGNAAHDLTGADSVSLHIRLADGTVITKSMTVSDATAGQATYTWLDADWTGSPALAVGTHDMEYEVVDGTSRLTFPNNANDKLVITRDLGNT